MFFLRCLVQQKNALAFKVETERRMSTLPELSEQLLKLAQQQGRITLRGSAAALETSRNTLKAHFSQLTAAGRLVRKGHGRGVWYEPGDADPLKSA